MELSEFADLGRERIEAQEYLEHLSQQVADKVYEYAIWWRQWNIDHGLPPQKCANQTELAKTLGVQKATIMRWVDKGDAEHGTQV
ncbi:hypothetical protein [Tsukamurella soli]